MHLHPPKAPHSWSEFLREVGVIAVGILLALGAEQVIEALHWRERVAVADEGIKIELHDSLLDAYERLIVEPCMRGQIALLHDRLKQPGVQWTAAPVALQGSVIRNVVPRAYRAPSRTFATDVWKNAVSSGIISHMAGDRATFLSNYYYEIGSFESLQEMEAKAASRLTPLSEDGDVPPTVRIAMRGDLAEVDRANAEMVLLAHDLIDSQRTAHQHYDKAAIERDRRETLGRQRALRGSCVADLPLDLR